MKMRMKYILPVLLSLLAFCAKAGEIAVIVHPECDVSKLDQNDIAQIFLGRSNVLTPYDQPAASSIRAEFYRLTTGRSVEQVKAIWSKLVFSGRDQFPEELINSKAVKQTIASDRKSIGYIEKSQVDDTVKVVLTLTPEE